MIDIVDHDGIFLFVDDFTHTIHHVSEMSIDVIKTSGNLWLSAPAVMEAMGFQEDGAGGGYSRRLSRIDHPDIIKITNTPFRFSDGRRNRGSLISPRAVHCFAEGRVKGFNAIKAYAFLQWMDETLIKDGDETTWSPRRPPHISLEPAFRAVIKVSDENEYGEPLDPLRAMADNHRIGHFGPLPHDEIEFYIDGFGLPKPMKTVAVVDGAVIDEEDDFLSLEPWQ
jgi:hypothetical protein